MNTALLDITITATRRPKILFRTLHSFYRKCLKPIAKECRIIINVDPIGENMPSYMMLDVIEPFFDYITINMPGEASFSKAFNWCWKQSDAHFLFHLEEDWELLHDVDILAMMEKIEKTRGLSSLRLSAFPAGATNLDSMKNWNRWVPYNNNDQFYEIKQDERHRIGICGHPTLFPREFVDTVFPHMDPTVNPEKQFQGTNRAITMLMQRPHRRYGVWAKPGDGPAVRDIGREWMKDNGYVKKGAAAFFTEWERTR